MLVAFLLNSDGDDYGDDGGNDNVDDDGDDDDIVHGRRRLQKRCETLGNGLDTTTRRVARDHLTL